MNEPTGQDQEQRHETSPAHAHRSHQPESPGGVARRIEDLSAADGADVLEQLPSGVSADVAEYLDPETAGRIMAEMEPEQAASVIGAMEMPEASMVLAAMDPDDRVDVLEHIRPALHDELVAEMEPADADEVRRLEQYAPDTAGGIMTTEVTSLMEDLTVEQAISELRRLKEESDVLFYAYIVDKRRHLIGVLSMRDLILARPNTTMAQVMIPTVRSVPVTMDQEEVARLFRRYNYLAMPVVDEQNRLVGLITIDDVMHVLTEEATEDVQKMFGAGAEERLASPWHYSFKKRVWWLEVNLATAFLAAWVISRFDKVIAALPIIAAYQSIVSGMGGNAGAQSLAVSIRGMALGESSRRVLYNAIFREAIIGALTGVAVGLTTWACALGGMFGYHDHPVAIGVVVCMALIINHFLACTTGVAIPFAMKAMGFDPAQSATIFATTVTDCCGFFATLKIAQIFLHYNWLN